MRVYDALIVSGCSRYNPHYKTVYGMTLSNFMPLAIGGIVWYPWKSALARECCSTPNRRTDKQVDLLADSLHACLTDLTCKSQAVDLILIFMYVFI